MPKKHFEVAAEASLALIVQVKDNQPSLHHQIRDLSNTTAPIGSARSRGHGRNRDESRTVNVFDPADKLANTDWHSHIAVIIRVEREVFTRDVKTGLLRHASETAFYVSNVPITASRAATAIRAHWAIETTSHYSRDVTMGEDRSRIRFNPGIFTRLRSFAFNILKGPCCMDRQADVVAARSFLIRRGGHTLAGRVRASGSVRVQRWRPQSPDAARCAHAAPRRSRA